MVNPHISRFDRLTWADGISLGSRYRFAKNLKLVRIQDTQSDPKRPRKRSSSESRSEVSNGDESDQRSPSAITHDESEQALITLTKSVNDTETSSMHDLDLEHHESQSFQLRTRSTLRLEEGYESGARGL